jgi:uncharacterized protein YjbI with pentapeptide repeats
MDASSRPRRWRPRSLTLPGLLLAGLLATLGLAVARADLRIGLTLQVLGDWLQAGSWAWPLAAVLTLAALASPAARRRWPRPFRRIPVAVGIFVGLVGLTSLAVHQPGMVVLAVTVAAGVGLLAAWVVVLPRRLAPPLPAGVLDALGDRERLDAVDARTKLQNDLRTTALQAIAGLAVLAGAVLGFQQLTEDRQQATATQELTRQGQASERFTRAIDQLGSRRLEVQLGGIYGLEQIAQQAPANRLVVTEVLVAYLQRRIPRPDELPRDLNVVYVPYAPDAQAALTVLGRRRVASTDPPLNLKRLDLGGRDLRRANLSGADLFGADLRAADLRGARLQGTNLQQAYLNRADLRGADLSNARLFIADLRRAVLKGAVFRGADLDNTDLRGVVLDGVDLRGADLSGALLGDADLRGAIADQATRWPPGFD